MQNAILLITLSTSFLLSLSLPEGPDPGGWGPWRYTNYVVSGIEFRSKCVAVTGGDSKWKYQFRNVTDASTDYAVQVEYGPIDVEKNELSDPKWRPFEGRATSPVYETIVHGSCEQVHDLKIVVLCSALPVGVPAQDRSTDPEVEPCIKRGLGKSPPFGTAPK